MRSAFAVSPLSILTDEFSMRLVAFNGLTRDMRRAGVAIKSLVFAQNSIFIHAAQVALLCRRFEDELRGVRSTSEGRFVRNCVTIRGVNVVWFSLIREQGL
jgi:hypothetical protein